MASNKSKSSKYQRRVTLALKWYYIENLDYDEIQERMEEEGYGSYTQKTIRGYVNSKPGEEVREQIQEEHAHTRLQVAERQENMYQRARESEMQATTEEPILGMRPVMDKVDGRLANPKTIRYDWERVEPGDEDWPEWADPDIDIIIRFVSGHRTVEPGHKYPLRDAFGEPQYEQYQAGIKREEPDRTQRSFLRQEQQSHLTAKGEAMGIYEETINLQGDLGLEAEVEIPEELVQAVVGASHDRLSSDSGGDASEE